MNEIATFLGVNRQRVYRFIKKSCIKPDRVYRRVNYYDTATVTRIKTHFRTNKQTEKRVSRVTSDTRQTDEKSAMSLSNELQVIRVSLEQEKQRRQELTQLVSVQKQTIGTLETTLADYQAQVKFLQEQIILKDQECLALKTMSPQDDEKKGLFRRG